MTLRQAQLLSFLRERALAGDVAPSFREMGDHLGLNSTSGVWRLIESLEEKGLIVRHHNRDRAITVMGFDDYARGYRDGLAAAQAQGKAA